MRQTRRARATTANGDSGRVAFGGERGVVGEGAVRCGPLRALPEILDRLGVDADGLLHEAGLTRAWFDDPENVLSFTSGGRLFRRCVEASGCAHLGTLVGQRVTLSAMGAVGVLMQASPTVAHALEVMGRHFHVHDRGALLTVEVDHRWARLGYRVTVPGVEAVEQIYQLAAVAGGNFLRALCGPGWRPHSVELPFRKPRDAAPLREAIGAPLQFDAERMTLVFPAGDLARPVPTADPLLYRMMSERVEQIERGQSRDLVGRVRDLLQTMVLLPDLQASIVASRLGMSLRSLNRRLSVEGTSVREIRDEVSAETASQLLANTERTASEVAVMLGYSSPSAFSRAFRRWRGVAPARWRTRRRQPP